MPGRSDFYEKYLETLDHWHRLGWRVTAADWRGQTGSGRLGLDDKTGHVDDFATWIGDLSAIWKDWREATPGPHVLVAHSMGAHIALRALAEQRVDPAATVLTAPMLGLLPGLSMIPDSWVYRFARFMASRGDSRRPAWDGGERPSFAPVDRFEMLTSDRDRYDDESWWRANRPDLLMGAPSWGWLAAAFRSILVLRSAGYLEAIASPVLMLATRTDRLVDFGAIERAAQRIGRCELALFDDAAHELLRERDAIRDRVLERIDGFLDVNAPAGN